MIVLPSNSQRWRARNGPSRAIGPRPGRHAVGRGQQRERHDASRRCLEVGQVCAVDNVHLVHHAVLEADGDRDRCIVHHGREIDCLRNEDGVVEAAQGGRGGGRGGLVVGAGSGEGLRKKRAGGRTHRSSARSEGGVRRARPGNICWVCSRRVRLKNVGIAVAAPRLLRSQPKDE